MQQDNIPVNEKSTYLINLVFKDEAGNLIAPNTATYRIDDVDSGTAILAETTFIPSSSSHDLIVTAAQNAILDATKDYERRLVTVKITYGISNREKQEEFLYHLFNLSKVS